MSYTSHIMAEAESHSRGSLEKRVRSPVCVLDQPAAAAALLAAVAAAACYGAPVS